MSEMILVVVDKIASNNRKRLLSITVGSQVLPLPYSKLDVPPSACDPIVTAVVDRSRGRDEVRYTLRSRRQGRVDLDAFFDYNDPPVALRDRMLRKLSIAARQALKTSPLSVREVSRRMSTSPTGVYRLLDEKSHDKSMDRLVCLLEVLGCDVDPVVR